MEIPSLRFLFIELETDEKDPNADANWVMKLGKSNLQALCKVWDIKG